MKVSLTIAMTVLITLASNSSYAGSYSEIDFYWDSRTSPHKSSIIRISNQIESERKFGCTKISPGSVFYSKNRSSSASPAFVVECKSPRNFTIWFNTEGNFWDKPR